MAGISGIMDIAKTALQANQIAMEVVSHNIANVNTKGYTRQRAVLDSETPVSVNEIKIGMGVRVSGVDQAFDQNTTRAIRQNTSSRDEYQTEASVLSQLESLFNETGDSTLSNTMNDFWNAWQDVADNPGGIVERTALLEKAKILAEKFNSLTSDLTQIKNNMNTNLQMGVEKINDLTEKIAILNERIMESEADETTANDLRDQRNRLLEDLSSWVGNVDVEQGNGSVTVQTRYGVLLVDGNQHWEMSTQGDSIYWNNIPMDVSRKLTGGQIGGWLDMRDEAVPQYLANLDELAGTIMDEVNTLHTAGYPVSGGTGKYFFQDFPTPPLVPNPGNYEGAAAYMALSSDVLDHPENIAAGGLSADPGDNENALSIAALQTDESLSIRKWTVGNRGGTLSSGVETTTMDEYYQTLVGEIGITTEAANENQSFVQSMVDNLENLRDSVSGVNLDEEMTELLKLQRTYEANSKIISIADQMLESIMQLV